MSLFVTATGTDIGKTFVSVGLLLAARRAGFLPAALKPVVSGYDPAFAAESDPGQLLAALGQPADAAAVENVTPWRFAAPLSPDQAARLAGQKIDFAKLVAFCRRPGPLLIEGVGGVMVPLNERHTVLDWISATGLPALLVAGSYLGTLSHTLTALAVLRARGVAVVAILVNESEGATPDLGETLASLRRFAPGVPIHTLPHPATPDDPVFDRLADLLR
jgi:dethiobiotin synthetase